MSKVIISEDYLPWVISIIPKILMNSISITIPKINGNLVLYKARYEGYKYCLAGDTKMSEQLLL